MRSAFFAALTAAGIAAAAPLADASAAGKAGHRAASAEALVSRARPHAVRAGVPVWRVEMLSELYEVDRLYKSMTGPFSRTPLYLLRPEPGQPPELLWIVGFEAVMKGADGVEEISQEFMCHSNLDLGDRRSYQSLFPSALATRERLFSLAQGQQSIQLPPGVGIPYVSGQPLSVITQVLNHNRPEGSFEVRHHITVDFVRDRDLRAPLKPLVQNAITGYVLLEGPDGHFGIDPEQADAAKHGASCLEGTDAGFPAGNFRDEFDRTFSGFWVVPPGRQVNRSRVLPRFLDLPYDTTIHYIAAHLHPFAESLELRDLTTGTTLFKTKTRQAGKGRIGLAEVEYFASEQGLPIYKDHQYEIVSVYNNTTGEDQDSMAVFNLFLHAKDMDLSRLRAAAR